MSGAVEWVNGGTTFLPVLPPTRFGWIYRRWINWDEEYRDLWDITDEKVHFTDVWKVWTEYDVPTLDTYIDPSMHPSPDGVDATWHGLFGSHMIPKVNYLDSACYTGMTEAWGRLVSYYVYYPTPIEEEWQDFLNSRDVFSEGQTYSGVVIRAVYAIYVLEVARTLLHCFCVDLRTRGTKREP